MPFLNAKYAYSREAVMCNTFTHFDLNDCACDTL